MHFARLLLVAACLVAVPVSAHAHGIWGHIHVTGWAIENLPEGEVRDFFDDPLVMNAALFGSAFTDSGYWPQSGDFADRAREYSEHTHWEPFVEDFIVWIRENDPPPWESVESRQRVAFLMGCAAHGLQDEIFDSLFLFQIQEQDAGSQDNADPGSDGFLAMDGHIRFVPERYLPMDTLLELYDGLDNEIDADTIDRAVTLMESIYVNENGPAVAESLGRQYEAELPWTQAHYLDPDIPGSLRAEINPTAAYFEAIWKRLHDEFGPEDAVIATYPEDPRRLRSGDPETVNSWITFIFGAGVDLETLTTRMVAEDGGAEHPHEVQGTRWGHPRPRLVRLQPSASLEPGAWWEAQLEAGATFIDGTVLDAAARHRFQVACRPDDPRACPPVDASVPSIDGRVEVPGEGSGAASGSGDAPDAGAPDAGLMDADTVAPGATSDSSGSGGGCAFAGRSAGAFWWGVVGLFAWRRRWRPS